MVKMDIMQKEQRSIGEKMTVLSMPAKKPQRKVSGARTKKLIPIQVENVHIVRYGTVRLLPLMESRL